MLDAEGQEDAVIPPRCEAVQAPVAVGDVAGHLFAAGQAACVSPFAREGVEELGGEQASDDDLVMRGPFPHDHVDQHGALLAEERRQLLPRFGQGVAHDQVHPAGLVRSVGLELVDEADQAACGGHRENHLGRQVAEREVVPFGDRGVKAQE